MGRDSEEKRGNKGKDVGKRKLPDSTRLLFFSILLLPPKTWEAEAACLHGVNGKEGETNRTEKSVGSRADKLGKCHKILQHFIFAVTCK